MDLANILQQQAALLLFLGVVVFLAHHTSRPRGVHGGGRWFFAACICGSMGLALQAQRGHLPPLLTVVAGNLLFLLLTVFLTRAVELAVQTRYRTMPYLLTLSVLTACILAYYTFARPNIIARVVVASIALPVLLMPAALLLLRAQQEAIRAATRTLACILLYYILSCGVGLVQILHGAHPQSGARWTGALLISGAALCFLWIDLLRVRAELEQQAMTDPLTGLLNRRAMQLLGERELARATRQGTVVTLLSIDIDHFKAINDRYGHMVGDAALLAVADVLTTNVRKQDLTVRTGGDEFVVLLTDSSAEAAEIMRERIGKQVAALTLKAQDGAPFHVSVTVGCHTSEPAERPTYSELMRASDTDLYRRKQQRVALATMNV